MQRDLVERPYGRFFYLPLLLAARGHAVTVMLYSYKAEPDLRFRKNGIQYVSTSIFRPGILGHASKTDTLIRLTRPDWIVGLSDTFYGIMAEYLGRQYGLKSAIDAYDNFESYIPWCKPLHYFWRKAISGATLVTAAGPHLGALLGRGRSGNNVHIIPMAADQPMFKPMDKLACRRELRLPLTRKLVGYCGSLHRSRGVETLFEAFGRLRRKNPGIELLCSGRKEEGIRVPDDVTWLGYLADDEIPLLLNSLDVAVVMNRSSAFGNFSYPVKLYEAMTCQLPVIATRTPPAEWILSGHEECLAQPDDPSDLAARIKRQLHRERFHYGKLPDWQDNSELFEKALYSASKA